MWVALGFLTLVASVGFQWWMRWHNNWTGVEDKLAGIPCSTKVRSRHGLDYGLMVGIEAPETFRFQLKREGGWDRFFKWAGLTHEHQFGHSGFDPLVYVESDDQHLFNSLEGNSAFLHAAQHMFAAQCEDRWLKRVVCARGHLWMVIGCGDGYRKASLELNRGFAATLLPHLQRMQKELDACMPDTSAVVRDRYLVPAVVVLALSSGLAVAGVISWARSLLSPEFILDTEPLKSCAWVVAACVVGAIALAALLFLKGSSRLHLVLTELALVGTFGAWTTSSSVLQDINIELDRSPAVHVQRALVGKSVQESRRLFKPTSTTYLLQHQGWPGDTRGRSVAVSAATYEKASLGDTLEFEEHKGYFGWRWAKFKAWKPAAAVGPTT
ncbi:hypothetical protein [Hydrogenophaga flava]|uniref:hypothetical protein n=1 Tax=Hydrogenophaga flava TaxID=65657 RepID=UPI000824F373|nr:hypothetical protein [Hydrogenophaga flava]